MSTNIKDFGGIIKQVYEPSTESLNVNIVGSGSPTVPSVVRLSDGTGYLTTTVTGGARALDVVIKDLPNLLISHTDDSIKIGDGVDLMGVNADGSINTVDKSSPGTPTVANLNIAIANTEYNYIIASTVKRFKIKARGTSKIQFSYSAGQSGTQFVTISPGAYYEESNLVLSSPITIYVQTNKVDMLEIITWV